MKQARAYLFSSVLFLCTVWSITYVAINLEMVRNLNLLDLRVNSSELAVLTHLTIVASGLILAADVCRANGRNSVSGIIQRLQRPSSLLVAAIACTPNTEIIKSATSVQSQDLPVQSLLSPPIAAAALREVLNKRREQVRSMQIPDVLSEGEQDVLRKLLLAAKQCNLIESAQQEQDFPQEVRTFLIAVDRISRDSTVDVDEPNHQWSLLLQVFGYPRVVNRAGEHAQFEKKRALELVTWMALNRDRSRRSAARTAIWDGDVADTTFSTVISSMRRGLSAIDSSVPATEWSPPTYSDELSLSSRILTDDRLIACALREFREDKSVAGRLLTYLPWVRDVPFAGTGYSWADLDGTTTRLVILAMAASREVATWALENGNMEALSVAVSAGLRVMPGDEELLSLQSSFLKTVREVGAHSVA